MKILVKIKGSYLYFSNKKKLNTEYKNMLNTNVISNDELVFSDEYIKLNQKIVYTFLNELIKNYNLNTISFQNNDVANHIMSFFPKIKNIINVYFESDEILLYKYCEKLCKSDNLKYVSSSFIPPYMFETLDKYGIIPESRNEILFTSNFMELNGLSTYSSLFYKMTIYVEFPLSNDDLIDFTTFCKINRHLKLIHINMPNKLNIEEIIYILKEYSHRKVKILIHGDVHDPELIEYLRKNNKKIKKRYKISFKLSYSEKYIVENIAKETNNNILRMCGLIIFALIILSFTFIFYDNYKSMLRVSKIQNEIADYLVATDPEEITKKIESNNGFPITNKYLAALKNINPDVVAWIKVNETNIDYAITQSDNNEYYLKNNIYKEKDENGWLFMDYQNNPRIIDDNIIIYGHNRYMNGVMFGTLNRVLYKNWYSNKDNLIINFDTLYGSYKYKVFSVYTILITNDYLTTSYFNPKIKLEFLNKIKDRSIYDFGVSLDKDSKILTLSTCQNETTRIVLHAVLIDN